MNTPEQEQIAHWLSTSMENIRATEQALSDGYYLQKKISLQSVYTGTASDYARLARAKFLNDETLASVRHEFNTAALCINKSFSMAYDVSDADYVGDKLPPEKASQTPWGCVSWSDVSETDGIDGFNFALMAANIDTAKRLANLFQDRKNGKKMFPCINRYAHALKHALLQEQVQGLALLKPTLDTFTAKPPKQGYKINYLNLSLTLSGILSGDEALFNQGLEQILNFYKKVMIPADDYWDTAYEFICDDAVALANLGLSYNLEVTIDHELLPKRLLAYPSST
ncbi:hypothetical protein [Thalassomonas haliotis]|uniref:Alginate lyase domain-containing protein n=1 Tax=Thalassomonas haliotis TaxID=485448 RepID=A0ABY7VBP7_9GAMM|nr:hypothetical protein [Thalassomonas haliotis]WDE11058.1 hypothetical protein H3N35_22920 [Thalassomonas haliotis]